MDAGKRYPRRNDPGNRACRGFEFGRIRDSDWRFDKREVKCQSCHAITVFEASRAAQRCEFCGSPSIVPVETTRDAITPTAVLPARLSEPQVRDRLRQWYSSRIFAPDRFKKAALTDTLHGVYLPYWTFDAHVHAAWTAMAGHVYFENVQRRGSDGRLVNVAEQRVRWEPAAGEVEHFFDDDPVPGTMGVELALLRKVEPFPTRGDELKPYEPTYLRGWTVERYQVDLRKAAELNLAQMDAAMRDLCAKQVPGDTQRDLRGANPVSRPHVQACSRAGVARYLYLRTEELPNRRQWLHRGRRRRSSDQLRKSLRLRHFARADHHFAAAPDAAIVIPKVSCARAISKGSRCPPELSTESWFAVGDEDEPTFFRAFGKIRWQSDFDAGCIAVSL